MDSEGKYTSLRELIANFNNGGAQLRESRLIVKGEITRKYSKEQLAKLGEVVLLGFPNKVVKWQNGSWKADWSGIATYALQGINGDWQIGTFGHKADNLNLGLITHPDAYVRIYPVDVRGVSKKKINLLEEKVDIDFNTPCVGIVRANTKHGIFGALHNDDLIVNKPTNIGIPRKGPAKILTTINSNGPQEFDVDISRLYTGRNGNSLVFELADDRLISQIGKRVVCGMSGSPIVQNGELVAVTSFGFTLNEIEISGGIWAANMVREHIKQMAQQEKNYRENEFKKGL